jgi:hypothetical protein
MRNLVWAAFFIVVSAVSTRAQTTFTFTATVTTSPVAEYKTGDIVTVSYVTSALGSSLGSASEGGDYTWVEELDTDPVIFTSMSLTGATGTWMRPEGVGNEGPESAAGVYADLGGSPFLFMSAGSDFTESSGASTGLFVGDKEVHYVLMQTNIALDFGITSTLPDINEYFSNFLGTYALTPGYSSTLQFTDGTIVEFDLTSLTISQVPEPASTVTLSGGALLVAAVLMRRRRSLG